MGLERLSEGLAGSKSGSTSMLEPVCVHTKSEERLAKSLGRAQTPLWQQFSKAFRDDCRSKNDSSATL